MVSLFSLISHNYSTNPIDCITYASVKSFISQHPLSWDLLYFVIIEFLYMSLIVSLNTKLLIFPVTSPESGVYLASQKRF